MNPSCWCGHTGLLPWNDDYARCPACETLVDLTAKAPLEFRDDRVARYGESYWLGKMAALYKDMGCDTIDDILLLHYRERAAHWAAQIILYAEPGAKVLEMGCGLGTLTRWLCDLGYQAVGTELNPFWREYLRRKLGITVLDPAAVPVNETGERYDVLIAMDVLEHLPNPMDEMEKISATLSPGGILLLQLPEYPAAASHAALAAGNHPFLTMLLPGEHLFLYSRQAVAALLARFGFTYLAWRPNLFPADMFLFASREPLAEYSPEQAEQRFMALPRTLTAYAALKNAMLLSSAWQDYGRRVQELEMLVTSSAAQVEESDADPYPARPFAPYGSVNSHDVERLLYLQVDAANDDISPDTLAGRLAQLFPRAEITVVCDAIHVPAYEVAPLVTRVLPLRMDDLRQPAYLRQAARLLQACRADAAVSGDSAASEEARALLFSLGVPVVQLEERKEKF